jgi:hypothetical protein
MTGGQQQGPPLLRIVRGEPTDEEVVALVTALLSRTAGTGGSATATRSSAWSARSPGLRLPLWPGPGAWRATTRPAASRTKADW